MVTELPRIIDWFVLHEHKETLRLSLIGQDPSGVLTSFEDAGFLGFFGEGGASDAAREFIQEKNYGQGRTRLARLEMWPEKITELSGRLNFADSWVVIYHPYIGNVPTYYVYGPGHNGCMESLGNNNLRAFCTLGVRGCNDKSAAMFWAESIYAKNNNGKSASVYVASWHLHIF